MNTEAVSPAPPREAFPCGIKSSLPFRQRRILVVDDDPNVRDLENIWLSKAGYIVDAAADGEEAWNALLSAPYDLLLTDHNMPRLRGLDLVARMRAAGIKLPVIINSAWPGLDEAAEYLHLSLTVVLHKPNDLREVKDAVNSIFSTQYESFSTEE